MIERISVYYAGVVGPQDPGSQGAYALVVFDNDEVVAQEDGAIAPDSKMPVIPGAAAEYLAAIRALDVLIQKGRTSHHVRFYGDSLIIPNHMSKLWAPKSDLEPFFEKAISKAWKFRDIQFTWVSRKQNARVREVAEKRLIDLGINPSRITYLVDKEKAMAKPVRKTREG